jgi:catechol 2,3-dioxygenase-like lactoylglutathione lyase family enzyme
MITAVHALIYAQDAAATRAFLRDTLGLKFVESTPEWPIFTLPPAEAGVHPLDHPQSPPSGTHVLYLMCDDIERTIAELKGKGVEFASGVSDEGWGLLTMLKVPGGGEMGLYQPRHPVAAGR